VVGIEKDMCANQLVSNPTLIRVKPEAGITTKPEGNIEEKNDLGLLRLLSLAQGIGRLAVEVVKVLGFDGVDVFVQRFV
jgi:hypothetical protein